MTRRIIALASLVLALSTGVASAETPLHQAKRTLRAVLDATITHYSIDVKVTGNAQAARCDPFTPMVPETVYCTFTTTRPSAVCVVKLHVATETKFNGEVLCGRVTGAKRNRWAVTTYFNGNGSGIKWSNLQGSTP